MLSTIVEADETYRLDLQKGARKLTVRPGGVDWRGIKRAHDCLLVARDRSGATLDFHTGRGQVTAAQFCTFLTPVLSPDVMLVSDGAMDYRHFAARAGQHARGGERQGRHPYARRDPHPERERMAQPLQGLARAISRRGQPVSHSIFRLAPAAGCAALDDAGRPADYFGSAQMSGQGSG
jgi:hypothetical protein